MSQFYDGYVRCQLALDAQAARVAELEAENAALKEKWLKEKAAHDKCGVELVKLHHQTEKPYVAELVRLAGEYRAATDSGRAKHLESALARHAYNNGEEP